MFGRTNAGGGINPFAFIFVTYPEGSICTCSDGSRTLKLKDTSGYGVFYPPYAATWTVTITDGTDTASEDVVISTEGQNVSVELSYDLVFYSYGEELEAFSVVEAPGYSGIIQYNEDNITFGATTVGGLYGARLFSDRTYDLTKYSKLVLTCTYSGTNSDTPALCITSTGSSVSAIGYQAYLNLPASSSNEILSYQLDIPTSVTSGYVAVVNWACRCSMYELKLVR